MLSQKGHRTKEASVPVVGVVALGLRCPRLTVLYRATVFTGYLSRHQMDYGNTLMSLV